MSDNSQIYLVLDFDFAYNSYKVLVLADIDDDHDEWPPGKIGWWSTLCEKDNLIARVKA